MSDGGLNNEYKEKWAAAREEHGDPLPKEVVHRLQEDLRLAWVKHVKGAIKVVSLRGEQEAEGQEEEDPAATDSPEDGESGDDASELAPAETLETRRPAQKRAPRATGSKKRQSNTRKGVVLAVRGDDVVCSL